MLMDLLDLRAADVDPSDADRYLDERRTVHDAAFPPRHAGEAAIRRFFAAVSPYGASLEPGRGRAWSGLRRVVRRHAPRRVLDAVAGSDRTRTLGAVGFDWYDPVASHAMRVPGRRTPSGRRDWSVGRALWDVESHPAALRAWCATEAALRPGLPLWVIENGMATSVRDGRNVPRADGLRRTDYVRAHLGAVAHAVADGVPVRAYLHWSLVDNYEWGSYEPRFGLFGIDRRDPGTVRWMQTDAQGDDAAGEFARVLGGLRAGDPSVLDAPASG
jgi:hypothetical protein